MFEFCLPTRSTKVPDQPDWFHEIKCDGYRIRVERDRDRVRLITRGGYDWTSRSPWIGEAALKNRVRGDGSQTREPRKLDCAILITLNSLSQEMRVYGDLEHRLSCSMNLRSLDPLATGSLLTGR
jgi:hypothetical protein